MAAWRRVWKEDFHGVRFKCCSAQNRTDVSRRGTHEAEWHLTSEGGRAGCLKVGLASFISLSGEMRKNWSYSWITLYLLLWYLYLFFDCINWGLLFCSSEERVWENIILVKFLWALGQEIRDMFSTSSSTCKGLNLYYPFLIFAKTFRQQ